MNLEKISNHEKIPSLNSGFFILHYYKFKLLLRTSNIQNKMNKTIISVIFLILIITSCSTSKETVTLTSGYISKPTHLQPDTCLTDKQLKAYYKFVKDSIKIELKRDKQTFKKEIDSLKIELKMLRSDNSVAKYVTRFDTKRFNDSITKVKQMYSDSLKVAKMAIKQENKTIRTEVRQENKTERAKLNRWWLFFIGVAVGVVIPIIFRVIKKQTYIARLF